MLSTEVYLRASRIPSEVSGLPGLSKKKKKKILSFVTKAIFASGTGPRNSVALEAKKKKVVTLLVYLTARNYSIFENRFFQPTEILSKAISNALKYSSDKGHSSTSRVAHPTTSYFSIECKTHLLHRRVLELYLS